MVKITLNVDKHRTLTNRPGNLQIHTLRVIWQPNVRSKKAEGGSLVQLVIVRELIPDKILNI